MKTILAGLAFVALWSSASVATKLGLRTAEPFAITNMRFIVGGLFMLLWAHGVKRYPLPPRQDRGPLVVYGILNCSLYLGMYAFAMRYTAAGTGSLAVGLTPLLIIGMSALFLGTRTGLAIWIGLLLGVAGVGVATWPLLQNGMTQPKGLALVSLSMISYSLGTIYFSNRKWSMERIAINAWQITAGAITLLPVTLFFTNWERHHFDLNYWASVWWLAIPVSTGAVQLWLYLLHLDRIRAALWLFLTPVLGFFYAYWLMDEPVGWFTAIGTVLVTAGLYIGQKKPKGKETTETR